MLLVEGDPAREVAAALRGSPGSREGLLLVTAVADELSQATPLAPLLSRPRHGDAAPRSARCSPGWRAGAAGPVLVTVDDVQWLTATMHAFGPCRGC